MGCGGLCIANVTKTNTYALVVSSSARCAAQDDYWLPKVPKRISPEDCLASAARSFRMSLVWFNVYGVMQSLCS